VPSFETHLVGVVFAIKFLLTIGNRHLFIGQCNLHRFSKKLSEETYLPSVRAG
jgi:hypothetical protein